MCPLLLVGSWLGLFGGFFAGDGVMILPILVEREITIRAAGAGGLLASTDRRVPLGAKNKKAI